MGKITIKISDESHRMLKDRAIRNLRSLSKEVEFLIREAEKNDKKSRSEEK